MEANPQGANFELFNGLAVSHRLVPRTGVLGRAGGEPEPDIGLDEDTVSARHARWETGSYGVRWWDEGSSWGTTFTSEAINGGKETAITAAGVELGEGDRIRFGRGGWWWIRRSPRERRETTARFTGIRVEVTGAETARVERLAGRSPVSPSRPLAPQRVLYLLTFLRLLGPNPARVLDHGLVSEACGKTADAGYRLQKQIDRWTKDQGLLDRSGGARLHRLFASDATCPRGTRLDLPFDGLLVEDSLQHLGFGERWRLLSR